MLGRTAAIPNVARSVRAPGRAAASGGALFLGAMLLLCLPGMILDGCHKSAPEAPPAARTLAEARQKVLDLFGELDGFTLEKQLEVGLAGCPAVRMEAAFLHQGQRQRAIVYVVDHPQLFNVVSFISPADEEFFNAGYDVFQKMLRALKVDRVSGHQTVTEAGEEKILRSPDLQLEIRYPASWVYTRDEVNRALVFSGPREEPSWLTTVNFSVINKWGS